MSSYEGLPIGCSTIFWPGCSLADTSQELTEEVFGFLRAHGLAEGLTSTCCGTPLRSSASAEKCAVFSKELVQRLCACGVRRIVAACPNCFCTLRDLVHEQGIEVVALPQVLGEAGLRITKPASVCVHDSCPDQQEGVFAKAVRSLFIPEIELREKEHHGKNSRCCGLGGFLLAWSSEQSEQARQAALNEFAATDAELLVTACASCASNLQEPSRNIRARHYLELLFDTPAGW